jgi:hypothetical protein
MCARSSSRSRWSRFSRVFRKAAELKTAGPCHKHEREGHGSRNDNKPVFHGSSRLRAWDACAGAMAHRIGRLDGAAEFSREKGGIGTRHYVCNVPSRFRRNVGKAFVWAVDGSVRAVFPVFRKAAERVVTCRQPRRDWWQSPRHVRGQPVGSRLSRGSRGLSRRSKGSDSDSPEPRASGRLERGERQSFAANQNRRNRRPSRRIPVSGFKRLKLHEYAASLGYELDASETSRRETVMRKDGDKISIRVDADGHYVPMCGHSFNSRLRRTPNGRDR